VTVVKFPRASVSPRLAFDVCHEIYVSIRADLEGIPLIDPTKVPSDHLWRAHRGPNGQEFVADFGIACHRALAARECAAKLILCNLYYLQTKPYEHVRQFMGIREDVWSDWTEDIRDRVGRLLMAKGMFPPRAYFGERSRPRKRKEQEPTGTA
jgi:hypothetical protein